MKKTFTLLMIVGLLFFTFIQTKAAVINVSEFGSDGTGDGSPGNPYGTIPYALSLVPNGDTIIVQDGYYSGSINIFKKDITLMSASGPENCSLDGLSNATLLTIDSCTVNILGFYLSNAYDLLIINGANVMIEKCMFDGEGSNKGITFNGFGGMIQHCIFTYTMDWAITVNNGNPQIINNTFFNNSMTSISIGATESPEIINNIIAYSSDAIYLNNSTFSGVISYNDFWNNGNNVSGIAYSLDGTNIYSDPMFVNESMLILDLQSGSPCIDNGDPSIQDFDMSISDIGAIPFGAGGGEQADFYYDMYNCDPSDLNFYNTSYFSDTTVRYEWWVDDVFESGNYDFNITLYSGSYYIELFAINSTNDTVGNRFEYINIDPCGGGGNIYFDYTISGSGCPGDTVYFYNNSYDFPPNARFEWNIDGNFNFTGFELPDTTLSGGNHNISLDAYDSIGNHLGSDWRDIYINGSTGFFRTSTGPQACPDQQIIFMYDDNGYMPDMQWDMGEGSMFYNQNHFSFKYPGLGTYYVRLVINDICGTDTIIQPIEITNNAVPEVHAYTEHGNEFCPYDEVTFSLEGFYPIIDWMFADGTVLHGQEVKYAFSNVGSNTVIVNATNDCGKSGSDTLEIMIRTDLEVYSGFDYYTYDGKPLCPGNPIEFNPYGPGSFKWNFGDGVTSTEARPMHAYTDVGDYDVTLVTYNNCGFSDTTWQQVYVYYNNGYFGTGFEITREGEYNDNNNGEPLVVCPGEPVRMKVYDEWDNDLRYFWDFDDGFTSTEKDPVHTYGMGAVGTRNVKLVVVNNCNDSAMEYRQVIVDPSVKPITNMHYVPAQICPGDKVYFFDSGNDNDNKVKFVYDINFGDGNFLNGITDFEDPKINTLASHVYNTAGPNNFTFTATNICGNTDTLTGTILVEDNATNLPFYYISNSTQGYDEGDGIIEDWSNIPAGPYHSFRIPVMWTAWPGMSNSFFVFFWYGDFDPEGDTGEPDGFVAFNSSTITTGDSVMAYIPVKITEFHSIGMAAAWYCDSANMGSDPDVFGMPVGMDTQPIKAFPLTPGDFTSISTVSAGPIMLDPAGEFMGECLSSLPNGYFNAPLGTGKAYKLRMGEDQGELKYDIAMGDEFAFPDDGSNNHILDGTYMISNDTIRFYTDMNFTYCQVEGTYTFDYDGDSLIFQLVYDECSDRQTALTSATFFDMGDGYHEMTSGCPGDPVEFTVVGGTSYKWHFGGAPITTTEQYINYTYADTGMYNPYVVITNSCNRNDTVYSPVRITSYNLPKAEFDMYPWDPFVGDTVQFKYWGDDRLGTYIYTWDFGDGTPLVHVPNPKHVFKKGGDLNIKLIVQNGCGENVQDRYTYVRGGLNTCDLEARFVADVVGTTATFIDNSYGNYTNISWDFGDGYFSNEAGPVHAYTAPGIYTVCLSIIDEITQCQNYICQEIQIGTIECFADFTFTKIDATNTIKLNNLSVGATQFFWDFGDGMTSNLENPEHVYANPGLYPVFLQISNATQSCFGEKIIEIQVGEIDSMECFPEFAWFVDSMTVTFTDLSSGNITNWFWNLGDGTTSNEPSFTHTYMEPGLYEICMSVKDTTSDCNKQLCRTIKVGVVDCQAKFTYFVDGTNNTVKFNDKSIGAISEWFWDFGDGDISTLKDPDHTYITNGIFPVCLRTFDQATGCHSEVCNNITVGQIKDCFAEFEFFIDNLTVSFADKSLGNINGRRWDFGNNTFSYKSNPVVTFKEPGIKNVCYLVFDTITGCQSEVCKEIQVGMTECGAEFSYFVDPSSKKVDFINNSFGTINNWLWEFGNGKVSFDTNATATYLNYGTYNVCLTVSQNVSTGCVSTLCKEVIVKDESTTLCNTKFTYAVKEGTRTVTFKDATLSNVTSWFWDFGDGIISKDSSYKHTYVNDGVYNVCLSTINDVTGCFSEKCKPVIISAGVEDSVEVLTADFTFIPHPDSNIVKFVDNSTGSPTNYYWTFGDGKYMKGLSELSHKYAKAGKYTVCLNVFDETTGNISEKCKLVPVGIEKPCEITAAFGKFIDPDTRTVNFSDKSLGTANAWYWSFGDGSSSSKQNPVHQYTKPGLFLVSLSARDEAGGCADYFADFIQVGSINCKANFSYSVDADSNKITLKSESSGSIEKYFWSYDDGMHGRGKSISHKYKKPGMYMIGLTISTSGGLCTDYNIKPIQIGNVDCSADFSVYVDSSTNTAYFTSEAIGNTTKLLWQFGDGIISTAENPIHLYKKPGYFTVGLNTFDPDINCMDYTEEVVLIGQKGIDCEADFYYQNEGMDVEFYDKSIGDDLSYFWWLGDGETSSTANPAKTYMEGGYYQVCLTVYTSSGIQNTTCKFVAVDPPQNDNCLAQFIYNVVDSANNTIKFIDQSFGEPNKWIWKFGDDNTSNEQNPQHTYAEAGYYKVRLVSGDTVTNCKSRAWEMVNVSVASSGLLAGFGYEKDTLSLKTGGYPVDFIGVSAGKPARYVWDFGDGGVDSTNVSPNHEYTEAGDYYVCLTVEDQVTEESDQACDTVSVGGNTINIPAVIANNINIDLTAQPNPFNAYTLINYSIPYDTKVTLNVFDETGRIVKTLINTVKQSGDHSITWDAVNISNGIYYIQLSTSDGIFKTKMVVKR